MKRRIVLVEDDLYQNGSVSSEIDKLVDKWVADGQPRDTIEIQTASRTADPATIRSNLDLRAEEPEDEQTPDDEIEAVDGLFILGNIPSWNVKKNKRFYTDLPYSLPTVELVSHPDGNGLHEAAIESDTLGSGAIAVGRYTTKALNGQSEADRTTAYLKKVNDYWDQLHNGFGERTHDAKGLVYMDPYLQQTTTKPMFEDLAQMYDARTNLTFDGGPDPSSSDDSAQRFVAKAKDGYEWVTLGVHGTHQQQSFLNGKLTYRNYKSHDLPARFFHLQSCQNGKFRTFGRVQINLAEVLLSQTSKTVGVVASSTSIWVEDTMHFYDAVGRGVPVGRAMGEFYRYRVGEAASDASNGRVPIDRDVLAPHFFGDPFLRTSWRPDLQKVYSFDPTKDSDVEMEAGIGFARAGGSTDVIEDEGYTRVATFEKSQYDHRTVKDVHVSAIHPDSGSTLDVPASTGSVDDEWGAIAFEHPANEPTALHSVWLEFEDGTMTRATNLCSGRSTTIVNRCDRSP